MPEAPAKPRNQFAEIGVTGLVQYAGQIREEILGELIGSRWVRNVQLIQNDPIASAAFFAISILTRQVTWDVVSPTDANEDEQRAQFIRECLDDMSSPWKETVNEIHSYMPWGWSWHELCYKRRNGPSRDPDLTSRHTDGKIGWAKWPIRAQESLDRWLFDDHGNVVAMVQRAQNDFTTRIIPSEKALHFRTTSHKQNPEGRSLCKPIFRPWYFKQKIENFEAIGIERDLNGIPLMRVPSRIMASDADANDAALFETCKQIVTTAKQNEMAGFVIPSDTYQDSSGAYGSVRQFEFELVSSGGQKQIDARKVIQAKNLEILLTLLLDFLMMGHEKVGSFALASSKTDIFSYALGAFLDSDCEVINRHAIPRLLRLNGMPVENPPRIEHGDIESLDLTEVATFLKTLSDSGHQLTDEQLLYVFKQTGLPVPDDANEMRKQEQPTQPPSPPVVDNEDET